MVQKNFWVQEDFESINFSPKKFCAKKNLHAKKFWVQKNSGPEIFGFKISDPEIFGKKKFGSKKNFGSKSFWDYKTFWDYKKIRVTKHFGSKKI